jgi:hypothetical protein
MRSQLTLFAIVVAMTAARLQAQTDLDSSILAGRIFPAEVSQRPAAIPGQEETAAVSIFGETVKPLVPSAAARPKPQFLVLPLFADSDAATVRQLNGGILYGTTKPVRMTLTYSRVSPDGGPSRLQSYGGALKWKGWSKKDVYALTVIGAYSDTRDSSTKAQIGLVDEFHLVRSLTGGIDLRWVSKSGTSPSRDFVPQATLAYTFRSNVIVGTNYVFKSDVDRQNDYGAELQLPSQIPAAKGTFIVGLGKHRTFRVAFAKVFGPS